MEHLSSDFHEYKTKYSCKVRRLDSAEIKIDANTSLQITVVLHWNFVVYLTFTFRKTAVKIWNKKKTWLQKVCDKYRVEFTPNEAGNKLVMKTDNKEVINAAEAMVNYKEDYCVCNWIGDLQVKEYVPQLLGAKGLQPTRIQNLKMCTVPVWIFSSFALRNIISGGLKSLINLNIRNSSFDCHEIVTFASM